MVLEAEGAQAGDLWVKELQRVVDCEHEFVDAGGCGEEDGEARCGRVEFEEALEEGGLRLRRYGGEGGHCGCGCGRGEGGIEDVSVFRVLGWGSDM